MLQDKFDHVGIARDEGAEAAEGLAQRSDQERRRFCIQTGKFERAASARPEYAQAVRVVDQQPGAMARGDCGQFAQRRHVSVHAEQSVGGDHGAVPALRQDQGGIVGIRVPVAQQARAGQARAVDERGMVQSVL